MENFKEKARGKVAHVWRFHKGSTAWAFLTIVLSGLLMSAAIGIQREKLVLPAWFLGFVSVFSLAVGTAALYIHMIDGTYRDEEKAELQKLLSAKSEAPA